MPQVYLSFTLVVFLLISTGKGIRRLEEGFELGIESTRAESAEGGGVYLADSLAGHPYPCSDLRERGAPTPVETVAAFDDIALAFGEVLKEAAYVPLESVLHKNLLRLAGRAVVGKKVRVRAVLPGAHGRVVGHECLTRGKGALNLLWALVQEPRELFDRRLATGRGLQVVAGVVHSP